MPWENSQRVAKQKNTHQSFLNFRNFLKRVLVKFWKYPNITINAMYSSLKSYNTPRQQSPTQPLKNSGTVYAYFILLNNSTTGYVSKKNVHQKTI